MNKLKNIVLSEIEDFILGLKKITIKINK